MSIRDPRRKQTKYRCKTDSMALLMVRFGDIERSPFFAPPNFYDWGTKAKQIYMDKHFSGWTGVCNGSPWSMGGRSFNNRTNFGF